MDRERAFNIIAGIILANRDFDSTEKTELLKHLRETEGAAEAAGGRRE